MRTSIAIAILTLLSFFLGFIRDASIAAFFGGSWASDILFLALVIPVFLENVLGIALRDSLIPYLQYCRAKGYDNFSDEVARFGKIILLTGIVLLVPLVLFPSVWLGLLAPGWEKEIQSQAETAFIVGTLFIPVLMWSYYQTGTLNVKGYLVFPVWRSVFFNIGAIIAIVFWPDNTKNIIIGMLVGQAIHLLWMQWLMSAPDIMDRPKLKVSDSAGFMTSFMPLLIATSALQINVIAERFFASWLDEGSVSFLSYAYRLTTVPLVLFSFSILTVFYPRLVSKYIENDHTEFNRITLNLFKLCLYLMIPATLFFIYFSVPIIDLFFGRGEFDEDAIKQTSLILSAYSLGLVFLVIGLLGGRILLALGKTKIVMFSSLVTMIITVLLDAVFVSPLGAAGLALAMSIGSVFQAVVLWKVILTSINEKPPYATFFRIAFSTMIVALLFNYWDWFSVIGMLAGGILILLIFNVLLCLTGEKDLRSFILLFR